MAARTDAPTAQPARRRVRARAGARPSWRRHDDPSPSRLLGDESPRQPCAAAAAAQLGRPPPRPAPCGAALSGAADRSGARAGRPRSALDGQRVWIMPGRPDRKTSWRNLPRPGRGWSSGWLAIISRAGPSPSPGATSARGRRRAPRVPRRVPACDEEPRRVVWERGVRPRLCRIAPRPR